MISLKENWLQDNARNIGFPVMGVAAVEPMDPEPFRSWLGSGYAAGMDYLHRHLPLRANLDAILPEARSVILVAMPYPEPTTEELLNESVARFARGVDYHIVVRESLQLLWAEIKKKHPNAVGKIFVDSGPLPERELARRAGLGWVGSHSCLIHPLLGSRFVLGEILTTLEMEPSKAIEGSCADCRACMDACPTGAIVARGVVDARKCLSYLTIEHKGAVPTDISPLIGARLFGCDSCQDACPHNRRMGEKSGNFVLYLCDLLNIDMETFKERFKNRSILRAKRSGLLRNSCIVLGNIGDSRAIPALQKALLDEEPLVRSHAAWALSKLCAPQHK